MEWGFWEIIGFSEIGKVCVGKIYGVVMYIYGDNVFFVEW